VGGHRWFKGSTRKKRPGTRDKDNNNNNNNNTNVIEKEAEKILQYKDLITEIQRMWNMKRKVILVTKGATGTISKSIKQCLSY
jgi:D-arabinose 5-phosphate isomerase GutQ